MKLSRVLLRWYKSFNSVHADQTGKQEEKNAWNYFRGEQFPFIDIPIDDKITTIVGANEAGKSHLLAAVAKVMNGWHLRDGQREEYGISNICRYCEFSGLDETIWPQLGLEFSGIAEELRAKFKALFDKEIVGDRFTVIINGGTDKNEYATVYLDPASGPIGAMNKKVWQDIATSHLPTVQFIEANKRLSNKVHLSQMIDLVESRPPSPVHDPVATQKLVKEIVSLEVASGTIQEGQAQAIKKLQGVLKNHQLATVSPEGALEALLFRDVLNVKATVLQRLLNEGFLSPGSSRRLVTAINHRITERLDLGRYWLQDSSLKLQVDCKAGFMDFELSDKTEAIYTFDERSSGLRYFLSYYIQALAIREASAKNGTIILMDEPDGYLSAAGQRHLLSVFEMLVDDRGLRMDGDENHESSKSSQLIYSTHSPFLINRNYPERVRLVRKGEGSEGTQFVRNASVRRFEPVRSALSIDNAETLFVGALNVVVEGLSDQRMLIACIQRFGSKMNVSDMLDLNRVTFISAGGAPNVRRIVEQSGLEESAPVVVCLFDADGSGHRACEEIITDKVLRKDFAATLDQCFDVDSGIQVLEDWLPIKMLVQCIHEYAKARWNEDGADESEIRKIMEDSSVGKHAGDRVVRALKKCLGAEFDEDQATEMKAAVIEVLAERIVSGSTDFEDSDILALQASARAVCAKLSEMIDSAESEARRRSMNKQIKWVARNLRRACGEELTRAEVERWMRKFESECVGESEPARRALEHVRELRADVAKEATGANDSVDANKWKAALKYLEEHNW